MTGTVEPLHAMLSVSFLLPERSGLSIHFVVDTGCTGELTLSLAAVLEMGLFYIGEQEATLADDN